MALPRKLKSLNLFNEGLSYLGLVASVTLPKLTRKLEDWRGGGMDGTVKIDMGAEPLELEFTTGGPMRDVLRQYGLTSISGAFLRFAGAYQDDGTGSVDTVEITVRGRHEEIDMGEAKPGEGGEFKVKSALTYYRLDWNGITEIEIDVLNGVFIVGGIDRMAEIRAAVS
jgi:P2 family phage contractile tail tube protein